MFYEWEWWNGPTNNPVGCQICDGLIGTGNLVKGVKGTRWFYVHPECLEKYIEYDELRTKALSRFHVGRNEEGGKILKLLTKISNEINQTIVKDDDLKNILKMLESKKELVQAANKSKSSFIRKANPYMKDLDMKFSRLFKEDEKEIKRFKTSSQLEEFDNEDEKEEYIKNKEIQLEKNKKEWDLVRQDILNKTYEELRDKSIIFFKKEKPITNRIKYKKIINVAEKNICIIDNYFNKESLKLLIFALDEETIEKITDIRILTSINANGLNDDKFRDLFTNIKKELSEFDTIDSTKNIQMKVATGDLIKRYGKTHDRYFLSSRSDNSFTYASEAYIFEQTHTISRLKDVEGDEKVDFEKLWNDPKALDFLEDWKKIKDYSVQRKPHSYVKKTNNKTGNNTEILICSRCKNSFSRYSNWAGPGIKCKDCLNLEKRKNR
tara:strand:- start:522 stop:1832 length:1311 start_codon:yes stop_codon:yes gene_type:complete